MKIQSLLTLLFLFTWLSPKAQRIDSLAAFQLAVKEDILDKNYTKTKKLQVYTAKKYWQELQETDLAVHIISQKEIQLSGATHIAEVLRLAPSMIVRQATNGVYDVQMLMGENILQGNPFGRVPHHQFLLLIDNMPYNDDLKGNIVWEALPIDLHDIFQIEIINNPISILYGGNTLTGVVHIITQKGKTENLQVEASTMLANNDSYLHRISLQAGIGEKWRFRLSGHYHSLERFGKNIYLFSQRRFVQPDSLLFFDSQARQRNGFNSAGRQNWGTNAWITFSPSTKAEVSLHVFLQNSQAQGRFSPTDLALSTRNSNSIGANLNLRANKFQIQTSYQQGKRDFAVGYQGNEFDFSYFNSSFSYQIDWKNGQLRPEIQSWNTTFNDLPYSDSTSRIFNRKVQNSGLAYSLHLQQFFLPNKWNINISVRNEHFTPNKAHATLSLRIATHWQISNAQQIALGFTQAHARPFLYDWHRNYTQPDVNLPDGKRLLASAERVRLPQNQQISLQYRLALGQKFGLMTQLFQQTFKNYTFEQFFDLSANPEEPYPYLYRYENIADFNTQQRGVTTKIAYENNQFQTNLSFTLQQNTQTNSQYFDLKSTPNFWASWQASYQGLLNGKVSIFANVYYLANYTLSAQNFEPLLNLNTKISYKFWKNNVVFANLRNIAFDHAEIPFTETIRPLYGFGAEVNF
ncbi:MAG: TonB-dependent receptor plug domain-containing protein [Microscillaceae bacterium]|nr:TonB-dependent receptor plug domain-containing protein [Microscillaceae bacterium]MDW8460337.1 TonB-dependent receptor plug domain-containing protein [Cytophagales bacterium]